MLMFMLILLFLLLGALMWAAAKVLVVAGREMGVSIGLAVVIATFAPAVLIVAFILILVVGST